MTQAERTDLSDRLMRDAAIELIVEQGTAATTLKDVGEKAGYSRGLAGYRFGSRDALFSFVVHSLGEDWLQQLTEVTAGKVAYEAICAATDEHFRFCAESPVYVRAFYTLWFESVTPNSQLNDMISHIHERRYRDVVGWIEAAGDATGDVDAGAIAGQFCAAIIGIVYYWLAKPGDLEAIAKLHSDLKNTMRLLLAPEE
jgi:AcrR family transcriptional regulator